MAGILMEALERLPSELTLLSPLSSEMGMLPSIFPDQGMGYNDGGYVYAANGADLSGIGGGPMGTDTIPAFLSENEFVIDADSAQQFGPVLEKINNWEPQAGSDEFFLNDIDNMINEYGGV